ncbi:hypothetical protein Ocin01_09902 [Orchesella cincta]|uniref:Uncharacterized protein n=1 Tax=Orchesella cincta TaxID=48709 RepID=A0A1D2MV59_ORCCI|nr:hypothetical protein Ocin01_09902 [Orchesella cincta]
MAPFRSRTANKTAATQNENAKHMKKSISGKSQVFTKPRRVKRTIEPMEPIPTDRPVPRTVLDDLLLDGETPLSEDKCLPNPIVLLLQEAEEQSLNIRGGAPLSEFNERCETTDDCLQLSPFKWDIIDVSGECRRTTHLRCNETEHKCVCHDDFELRWDTEVDRDIFQWNPITKTCYVRASQPCKIDVPCAPGTTCRESVSFSFNTPPMQRVCECININLMINADDDDWWYCNEYWQRVYDFALDNVNRWYVPQPHFLTHFKQNEEIDDDDDDDDNNN